jgi:hypothetical protein
MKVSQAVYNTCIERFKAAMRRRFELNVCHMQGACKNGCVGRGRRCPYLPTNPITLAQADVEYDAAFAATEHLEVVPEAESGA